MLNEDEYEILQKYLQRNEIGMKDNISVKNISTSYITQGNFTICVLLHDGIVLTAGAAKRNPTKRYEFILNKDEKIERIEKIDKYSYPIGMKRSFVEALKNLF